MRIDRLPAGEVHAIGAAGLETATMVRYLVECGADRIVLHDEAADVGEMFRRAHRFQPAEHVDRSWRALGRCAELRTGDDYLRGIEQAAAILVPCSLMLRPERHRLAPLSDRVVRYPDACFDVFAGNLAYAAPDASEAQLWAALDDAQVGALVRGLPDGLDTVVGDRGYRLSGGEKQRMAIARLLLKAPGVVVLDEATAHLDSESEAAVQQALARALEGRTSLVIAHRLSTVRDADQILVLEAGRVVERGRHQELLDAGGLYAELYATQFAPQEVREALEAVELVD